MGKATAEDRGLLMIDDIVLKIESIYYNECDDAECLIFEYTTPEKMVIEFRIDLNRKINLKDTEKVRFMIKRQVEVIMTNSGMSIDRILNAGEKTKLKRTKKEDSLSLSEKKRTDKVLMVDDVLSKLLVSSAKINIDELNVVTFVYRISTDETYEFSFSATHIKELRDKGRRVHLEKELQRQMIEKQVRIYRTVEPYSCTGIIDEQIIVKSDDTDAELLRKVDHKATAEDRGLLMIDDIVLKIESIYYNECDDAECLIFEYTTPEKMVIEFRIDLNRKINLKDTEKVRFMIKRQVEVIMTNSGMSIDRILNAGEKTKLKRTKKEDSLSLSEKKRTDKVLMVDDVLSKLLVSSAKINIDEL